MKDFKVINDRPSIVIVNTPAIDVNRLEGEFYKYDYLNAIDKIKKIRFLPLENLVDDIKDGPGGWDINISDYVEQGVPMLRTINIVDGLVNLDECVFIDIEKHKQLKRSRVVKNDVLLSVRGTIGKSAVYSKNFEANINAALVKITLKDNIIDPYFLVAFFNCKYGRLQTERIANGAVQLNMNLTEAKSNLIPIPSPEIQKYIGDKVRKAEELREEAKRLKKEAEEIFNQNYEQIRKNDSKFEWVNSYYLNEDNIIPNFYKQYELLRDKKYVYIEFENIVESIKCGIPVRSDMRIGDIYPFYGASGVTDNIGDYNFDGEYLIVAQDGSIGSVNVARNKFWANNHVWVVKVKNGWDLEFLELYLNQYNYWISLTTGSVVPKVTSENLKKLLVPKINYEVQKSIGDKIREAKHKEQKSKALIEQAKQDVEDLIEGNFSMK